MINLMNLYKKHQSHHHQLNYLFKRVSQGFCISFKKNLNFMEEKIRVILSMILIQMPKTLPLLQINQYRNYHQKYNKIKRKKKKKKNIKCIFSIWQ